MSIEFIPLETTPGIGEKRQHSLALFDRWHGLAETVGVIQHCDRWRPATERDRDRFVQFLADLKYDD